jgi:hypothetical protein
MKWLRSNIRHGTRLALLALAVQFALSFGHAHGFAVQAAPSIHSSQQQPAPGPNPDQHPDDFCAICAAVALTSTAVAAMPPALPVPLAFELLQPPMGARVVDPRSTRAAFQSRAPPLS